MAKNTVVWVLYDSLAKSQSAPITTDDAQMVIFKLRPRELSRFYIWTQGWADWQPLAKYLETEQKHFVSSFKMSDDETYKAKIRDVLEMTPIKNKKLHDEITRSFSAIKLDEETITDITNQMGQQQFDGDEITWSNLERPKIDFSKLQKKKNLSSREQRHDVKIEIILISPKGKSFRSKSKNISLSGSLLEDNIPFDYYGITFDIVVVNAAVSNSSRSRISLKGKTVGDGLTQRLQYVDVSAKKKAELQEFLEEYVDLQRSYMKKSS